MFFVEEIWDMKRNNSFSEAEFSQAAEIYVEQKKDKIRKGQRKQDYATSL